MELMQSAVQIHVYTIYFFLAIMLFNLYSVYKEKEFIVLAKRLKFLTPLYHSINAVVIYTGTIVAFYAQTFSFTIALMIHASIFLLVIEIKSVDALNDVHLAQTLTYMKLGNFRLGLLINFNVILLKYGLKRVINGSL